MTDGVKGGSSSRDVTNISSYEVVAHLHHSSLSAVMLLIDWLWVQQNLGSDLSHAKTEQDRCVARDQAADVKVMNGCLVSGDDKVECVAVAVLCVGCMMC